MAAPQQPLPNWQPSETSVLTSVADTVQLASADPKRFAIGFAVGTVASVNVTTIQTGNADDGFLLPATGIEWVYYATSANQCQGAWFARPTAAPVRVSVYLITKT